MNSEIVLVATEATGRALRPVPSVLTPSPRCRCRAESWWRAAPSRRHQLKAELAERLQRLLRELRVRLRERLVEHQLARKLVCCGHFRGWRGASSAHRRGRNAISFSCSLPELSPALLCVRMS